MAPKSIVRFKRRIREMTGRSRGISMDRRFSELRSYLRVWTGYYGLASQLKLFDRLDQWLRHRIRMCYGHMSKTIASGVGLTNALLAEQGLFSIKTLWGKLAPLRRTA